jgi:ribosome-binding protein aMBF1 (putative translation factor)
MRPPKSSMRPLPPEWRAVLQANQRRDTPARVDPGERVAREDRNESDRYVHSKELRDLIKRLQIQRLRQGLSLADLAKRSEQARSAISRLENGRYTNPTLNTLSRYALALGMHIKLSAVPVPPERGTKDA